MLRSLKAYPALARAAWERAAAYRAVFAVTLLNAAFPLVMMAIWVELAREAPVAGFSAEDFIGYYLAAVLVRRITAASVTMELERAIHSGELSTHLLRPLHVVHVYLVRSLVTRSFAAGLTLLAAALGVWLTPGDQYDLRPLPTMLFIAACILGALFEFFVQFGIGGLAFWIAQVQGISAAFQFVKAFLGGYIVPLALFPSGLGQILIWTPFAVSIGMPVEILTGRMGSAEAIARLLAGAGWVSLSALGAHWVWRAGLRAYSAAGA
ncbi:MAG: ABC-2 family transporter protein [Anaerolineae bacterium]|nr:ABC-2 family transporter protein [Anaerolineae bacterium]